MADAAEKAIDLGFPAGVEAVGVIAPTSTDRRWSFGLRGDSYSRERLTTYDEIASALLQENQKASAPSLAGGHRVFDHPAVQHGARPCPDPAKTMADPERADNRGCRPICVAEQQGQADAMRVFLDHGVAAASRNE